MDITRSQLLKGALATSALLPVSALAKPGLAFHSNLPAGGAHPWNGTPHIGGGPLRFAVIGDNTGLGRPGVFDQACVQLSWLQPDFVLAVGDLVEGYTDDRARLDADWAAVEASTAKLGCPIIYTPGNHDMNTVASHEAWRRWRGPNSYHSFTYKGALFLVLSTEDTPLAVPPDMSRPFWELIDAVRADPAHTDAIVKKLGASIMSPAAMEDTNLIGHIDFSERQMRWIADTLAKNPNPKWTFVVLHRPAWKVENPEFKKIEAMLAGRPYTVFAGHTHYFTHQVFDGHDYINMGTTGGIRVKEGPGTVDHTVVVTLTPEGPQYANMRFTGLMNAAGETGQTLAY
jgi:UDP-2,3-diacylglucosamine pyrophosphatase LpxH